MHTHFVWYYSYTGPWQLVHGAVSNVMVPVHTVIKRFFWWVQPCSYQHRRVKTPQGRYAADKPHVSCNDTHMPILLIAKLCNSVLTSCKCGATICCQVANEFCLQVLWSLPQIQSPPFPYFQTWTCLLCSTTWSLGRACWMTQLPSCCFAHSRSSMRRRCLGAPFPWSFGDSLSSQLGLLSLVRERTLSLQSHSSHCNWICSLGSLVQYLASHWIDAKTHSLSFSFLFQLDLFSLVIWGCLQSHSCHHVQPADHTLQLSSIPIFWYLSILRISCCMLCISAGIITTMPTLQKFQVPAFRNSIQWCVRPFQLAQSTVRTILRTEFSWQFTTLFLQYSPWDGKHCHSHYCY